MNIADASTVIPNDGVTMFIGDNGKRCLKGLIAYMGYFGSRYVGNDIQVLCGNLLDHPIAKTFTLFCIMMQATDNLKLAASMTLFFLVVQYIMSVTEPCNKYVDKLAAPKVNIHQTVWAKNKELDALELAPKEKRRKLNQVP
jgi:hypothetical protein